MEEAAKSRLERLKQFQLRIQEPVSIRKVEFGAPKEASVEDRNDDESRPETAESLAQKLLLQEGLSSDGVTGGERDGQVKKPNWDLKKEYQRKSAQLQLKTRERMDEFLLKRLDDEANE